MSANRAGLEMVSGIQQFRNFKVLLKQAMESAGAHMVYAAYGADFNGWATPDAANSNVFYVCIRFEEPQLLLFLCESGQVRDEYRDEWVVDRFSSYIGQALARSIDLSSEDVHFFSRSLDSQMTVLEEFVSSCLSQTTYNPDPESAEWDELNDHFNQMFPKLGSQGRGDEDEGRGMFGW